MSLIWLLAQPQYDKQLFPLLQIDLHVWETRPETLLSQGHFTYIIDTHQFGWFVLWFLVGHGLKGYVM